MDNKDRQIIALSAELCRTRKNLISATVHARIVELTSIKRKKPLPEEFFDPIILEREAVQYLQESKELPKESDVDDYYYRGIIDAQLERLRVLNERIFLLQEALDAYGLHGEVRRVYGLSESLLQEASQ